MTGVQTCALPISNRHKFGKRRRLVVPSDAIQRIGEKNIVFVPKENEAGAFEVREVETGADTNGYTRIKSGLQLGEKVVTKGSFTLKTQLQKGDLGEE